MSESPKSKSCHLARAEQWEEREKEEEVLADSVFNSDIKGESVRVCSRVCVGRCACMCARVGACICVYVLFVCGRERENKRARVKQT